MTTQADEPVITPDSAFVFGAVNGLRATPATTAPPGANLGPLAPMVGTWTGTGFNTIFRPQSTKTPTQLPIPAPGDNILELNLTTESTTFTAISGLIPNRGMVQGDIALSGMIYLQQISDVTTSPATGIHIEPGIWVVIPPTTSPAEGPTVARMASIPHGTTVNAQGTTTVIDGPPTIPVVNITPSFISSGALNRFPSQTASAPGTARIPQDLTSFIAEGTLTQTMLDDPNTVLRNAIAHQRIISTTQVSISTTVTPPVVAGGGVDNIAFLVNTGPDTIGGPTGPNAQTLQMSATFWIETVERVFTLPPFQLGGAPIRLPLAPELPGQLAPTIAIDPGRELTAPRDVTLRFTQIQYSQVVILNFNGLSWPHVSVATLVSSAPLKVPPTAWS
jgi:hypothetical protein